MLATMGARLIIRDARLVDFRAEAGGRWCCRHCAEAILDHQVGVASAVTRYLPISAADATHAVGHFHRRGARLAAGWLSTCPAGSAYTVDQFQRNVAAPVTRRLTIVSAHCTYAVFDIEWIVASSIAGNLSCCTAMPTQALRDREPGIAAAITGRLHVRTTDVAQALPQIEVGVAAPVAGRIAFAAAFQAHATRGRVVIELALEVVADAARCGLGGVGSAAGPTACRATGGAAMRLDAARACVTHFAHVKIVRRIDLAISCPLRGSGFRTVATDPACYAAGLDALVGNDVASQTFLTGHKRAVGRVAQRLRCVTAGVPQASTKKRS